MDILKQFSVKTFLIIGLIIYIVLLQECNGDKKNNNNDITIDTVYSTTVDSIYVLDTIYLTTNIIRHDTIFIGDDTISVYENEVEDEMLSGRITSYIDGTLVDQEFNYIAKFPQYIHTIDTVRITKQERKDYVKFFLGGEIGGNINKFNLSPIMGWSNRKGNSYYYRYGVVDKTHNIGISRVIYKY